jgi:hypothetical protein
MIGECGVVAWGGVFVVMLRRKSATLDREKESVNVDYEFWDTVVFIVVL